MTTTTATAYRVIRPCVTVKGLLGSHGVFYQGETLKPWSTAAAGDDFPNSDEVTRLLNLGFIQAD